MTTGDIKRLNYIYYTSFTQLVNRRRSLFYCYLLFFARFLHSLLFSRNLKAPTAPVLIYASTLNNMRAVQSVVDNLKTEYVLWGYSKKNFPLSKIYFKSACHLGIFQRLYNSSTEDEKALIKTYYTSFMNTVGYYKVLDEILNKYPQIKTIVFSNDHSTPNRCLIELAEKRGIKTVYVQHASVTERFPSLHFTYSFLDGLDSYIKYRKIGDMKGKVILSGSPRFDGLNQNNESERIYDVGIALNALDNIESVLELCRYLTKNYSKKIAVRPHPRMKLDMSLFEREGLFVSDSRTESSFTFLSKIKVLVANESSIHLDSALTDTPSILYNFSNKEIMDWYSFLKKDLMPVCRKLDDVLRNIEKPREINKEAVRFYVASYKMPWSGKVGAMVASLIDSINENTDNQWLFENSDIVVK